jgi:hypothetical protein
MPFLSLIGAFVQPGLQQYHVSYDQAFVFQLCDSDRCYNHPAAESWRPQFRGPNGADISGAAKPPVEIAPDPNQLRKVSVPSGMSSPCVWRDTVFLTAFGNSKLEVHCYQWRDGKLLWKQAAQTETLAEFHARRAVRRRPRQPR